MPKEISQDLFDDIEPLEIENDDLKRGKHDFIPNGGLTPGIPIETNFEVFTQFEIPEIITGDEFKVIIHGEPISGSQLKFNRKTGNAYRPKEHKQRVFEVSEFARRAAEGKELPIFPNGIPVSFKCVMYFPHRKGDYRTGAKSHELKPNAPKWVIGNKDLDNLLKPLKDGLKGIVFADDNQIVHYADVGKLYSVTPRTEILIRRLSQ